MSGDVCQVKKLEVEVQENGIIRNSKGIIIARLNDSISFRELEESKMCYTGKCSNEDWMGECTCLRNGKEFDCPMEPQYKNGDFKTITLCGSTKFKTEYLEAQKNLH